MGETRIDKIDIAMIDLKNIKLIIWDLDDTLWAGTLSEGGVKLPNEHRNLIENLTDCGIINSICSKNDYDSTVVELKKLEIWEHFVFASINWENKGARIKNIIDQMALRPVNVLFLDDNTFNIKEAKFILPELQVAMPDIIPSLMEQVKELPVKDKKHKRLNQYKVLQEKSKAAEQYDSNEAFLFDSNIKVEICNDCISQIDRIHELILRTNQLNYTKKRISIEELNDILLNEEYNCGYVTVKDKYGDYGLVGFYAVNPLGEAEHFLFSCRTMGQMIEQYVYARLRFPKLNVVGEVRTQLNNLDCPAWINQEIVSTTIDSEELSCKILLKGPCDLSNSQSYIKVKDDITAEFTYVKEENGQIIDTYNHSVHIRGLYENTVETNKKIEEDCAFIDKDALCNGTFFKREYDVIVLSSLIESVYNIYQNKETGVKVVYRKSIDKQKDELFFKNYEYVGLTTPEEYEQFLIDCLAWLPSKTTLCIILGVTRNLKDSSALSNRHKEINDIVKKVAVGNKRLKYIDVDEFVHSENDITDSINHYTSRVYYEIAQAIIKVVKESTGQNLIIAKQSSVYVDSFLKRIRTSIKKVIKQETILYKFLKRVYLLLTRRVDNVK